MQLIQTDLGLKIYQYFYQGFFETNLNEMDITGYKQHIFSYLE